MTERIRVIGYLIRDITIPKEKKIESKITVVIVEYDR